MISNIRPKCKIEGCDNLAALIQTLSGGRKSWRPICSHHHAKRTCENRGVNTLDEVTAMNAGFDTVEEYRLAKAQEAGFETWIDFVNSTHAYLKYRKKYCENIDGRFGIICNYPIMISAQLQVDHIDGNPSNNDPENLQTLCANCHILKTMRNGDTATPGRKKLGVCH